MEKLILLALLVLLSGCAYNMAKLYDPATGELVAKSRTFTFFDSQSSLAKLHIDSLGVTNSHGSFSPGISISGLSQESSSTNINTLMSTVVSAAVAGAIKGVKGP